ncbi:hypothetical protein CALVIDRAFT_514241 [Calocera viscosa TUFC12733]|uniref:DNA mismatch repair proteins mutS family domain-containing protein n=1 Tax=Calocera viscosa (strain TUFC12733) TaxID=1330018 RepID=A0A167MQ23_CALVF|nr:hypothetical protein CALVIDRAFT_514241 [Calocera viscosa TUFC12733]
MPSYTKRKRSETPASNRSRSITPAANWYKKKKAKKEKPQVHWNSSLRDTVVEDTPEPEEDDDASTILNEHEGERAALSTSSDDIEQDEGLEQVCVAMNSNSQRVGAAIYDPATSTVYLLEDSEDSAAFDLAIAVLEQTTPQTVLTSSKSDEKFQAAVEEHCKTNNITYNLRVSHEFGAARGADRLLSLPIFADSSLDHAPSSPTSSGSGLRDAYDFMRSRVGKGRDPERSAWESKLRLSNWGKADGNTYLCMGSAAALLDHLVRVRATAGDLEDAGVAGLDIVDIKSFTMDRYMHINADALSSLQVFSSQQHANSYSDRSKESLSLYGLLLPANTPLTPSLLRRVLLRPLTDPLTIRARHDAISLLLHPSAGATVSTFPARLKGLGGAGRAMKLLGLRGGRADGGPKEWGALVKFAYEGALLREGILDLAGIPRATEVEIVRKLLDSLQVAAFREMATLINETIDWDASELECRVVVRPRVDEALDNVRHIYHGLDSLMSRIALEISRHVPPEFASELNVCYYPQLGYLITIPLRPEWQGEEDFRGMEGWSFQFMTEEKVYFKSQEMKDMDQQIGDVYTSMMDREIEIIHGLRERVMVFSDQIHVALMHCVELDCLLCFAKAAQMYDWNRPTIVEDNVIQIKNGRHPVQELCVESFVPNDCNMVAGSAATAVAEIDVADPPRNIMILTGANGCGKSVYLKQSACPSHASVSFVPAEKATIGIVDKIFTRCQTRESVSKMQSAFMIDLAQVSLAIRNCTARSLLILDEFGKGTRSSGLLDTSASLTSGSNGAGIFCGTIDHLLKLGPSGPKVLAATHFHEIFTPEGLSPNLPINFSHMQILFTSPSGSIIDTEKSDDYAEALDETITYLFRVAPGLALTSHAARCALLHGIPRRLVERAEHVTRLVAQDDIGQILNEALSEKERLELEAAEDVMKRFLTWDLGKWNTEGDLPDLRSELQDILDMPVST